uniref:PX domain-containing protein n=1 Tax=Glossina brevipalpis TaxID=37001 RepID=A0A1A9WK37_9MUSC
MSLRAIKKRESSLAPTNNNGRISLFKKSNKTKTSHVNNIGGSHRTYNKVHSNLTSLSIQQQYQLLGRATKSNPEVKSRELSFQLVRTRSDGDLNKLLISRTGEEYGDGALLNAKSEVCIKTITTHNYQQETKPKTTFETDVDKTKKRAINCDSRSNMLSGARSHRDLTQSSYASTNRLNAEATPRRMSEGNYRRGPSCRSSSNSEITLSSGGGLISHIVPPLPVDPDSVLRIPIIGYEVMEERARFTVYKLRVENPNSNDCWLVLRRYTDFVRLNNKLKQIFPHITLNLPRKKVFGDNFNPLFLDNRVQGLQIFVNTIMNNEELRKSQFVREFFCLDEPPTYSESMEECRAIFEAQEETIAHLKMQITAKNDLILSLQQKLREEVQEKEQLKHMLKSCNGKSNGSK